MARVAGGAAAAAAAHRTARNKQAVREALRGGKITGEHRPPSASSPSAKDQQAVERRPSSRSSSLSTISAETPERYLLRFGYSKDRQNKPQLAIEIQGHEEEEGHTFYLLACTLGACEDREGGKFSSTAWSCRQRLADLRETLHDAVKGALGQQSYEANFGETPFARHGGVPGTTGRLKAWLASLAACVNAGTLEPEAVVHVLRFLEAPSPEDGEARLKRYDQAALRKSGRCMVCTVAIGPHEQDGLCVRCLVLQADATRRAAAQSQQRQLSADEPQESPMPFFQGGVAGTI